MPRLPTPGSDSGTWGAILNEYLSSSLNSNGSLRPDTVGSSQLTDSAVQAEHLANGAVTDAAITDNSIAFSKISGLTTAIANKSDISHTHTSVDITDSTVLGRSLLTTSDTVSAQTALNLPGSYVSLANSNTLHLPADRFVATFGNPAVAVSAKILNILFDASSIEAASASFQTPSWWNTASITLWAATASTGTGVIRWNPKLYRAGPGDSTTPAADAGISTTVDMTAPDNINVVTLACGTFTCQADNIFTLSIQRNATSSSDTYPSDAGIVTAVITQVS